MEMANVIITLIMVFLAIIAFCIGVLEWVKKKVTLKRTIFLVIIEGLLFLLSMANAVIYCVRGEGYIGSIIGGIIFLALTILYSVRAKILIREK